MPPEAPLRIPAVVLAAGRSSRMGTPKQLLPYNGTHLLGDAIRSVAQAGFAPILVVLGCHAERIASELSWPRIHVVLNCNWSEGLASSVRCGLAAATALVPECEAVLCVLCDQPQLDSSHYQKLRAAWRQEPECAAVASRNQDVVGVPALIARELFPELLALSGDRGARDILHRHSNRVVEIQLPEAAADIDTPEDYRKLMKKQSGI